MSQPGRCSRFTLEELVSIRRTYDEWKRVRVARISICKRLGIRSDMFNKIGQGRLGKKPRPA